LETLRLHFQNYSTKKIICIWYSSYKNHSTKQKEPLAETDPQIINQ